MPYRFHDELSSADAAFEARGETLEELFISAAAALLHTMAAAPEQVLRQEEFNLQLEQDELNLLLFSFLQELIYYKDVCGLLLHADRVKIESREGGFILKAAVSGEQIDASRHRLRVDVKAVTLHRFQLQFADELWKADVVLDV